MRSPHTESSALDREMLSQGVGFRISRLARTLRGTWAEELTEYRLTPPLAAVLRGVDETPGVSVRALARTLSSDAMSVKRCADELEERGLLRSGTRPDDRRPRTLTLTTPGRTVVKKVNQRAAARSRILEDALSPEDRQRLDVILTRLERVLGIGGPTATDEPEPPASASPTTRKVR